MGLAVNDRRQGALCEAVWLRHFRGDLRKLLFAQTLHFRRRKFRTQHDAGEQIERAAEIGRERRELNRGAIERTERGDVGAQPLLLLRDLHRIAPVRPGCHR